jgi:hypothetical protein
LQIKRISIQETNSKKGKITKFYDFKRILDDFLTSFRSTIDDNKYDSNLNLIKNNDLMAARPKTAIHSSKSNTNTVEKLLLSNKTASENNFKLDGSFFSLSDQLLLLNNKSILPIQKNKNNRLNSAYSPRKNNNNSNNKMDGWRPKLLLTPMKGSPKNEEEIDLDDDEWNLLKPITVEGENIKINSH